MSEGVFVFDICVTLAISAYLLYSYGDWMRQRLAVTISVLIAWYFSFIIIFILPLDVSNTAYNQCVHEHQVQSNSSITNGTTASANVTTTPGPIIPDPCQAPSKLLDDEVFLNLWKVVYWSSQLLTWLVLPLMQSFTQAGEFTVSGKLKSALWDNSIYYASLLFIAIILFIYIAMQPGLHLTWDKLKAIAAAASNTWGLFVLVLMLGYGLVEVPRSLWRSSQRGYQLNRAYFKIAKLMMERTDAEEAAEEAVANAYALSQVVGQSDMRREHVDTILKKIPLELMERIKRRRTEVPFGSDSPTEKTLIRVHRDVIKGLQTLHRTEAQWADLTNRILELEDVNRNMISNEHFFKHMSKPRPTTFVYKWILTPTIEWYWKCLVSPLCLRFAAGFSVVMSALIIWSEVTFFSINPPLSLFAVFINLAKANFSYWAIELICFVTICYLSICAYYTIFKIRILNYYYLAGNHQSDEYTLLFSGLLLCRLTPPLCLNFLSIIHMDSYVIKSSILETSYTQVMGHMAVLSIVSQYFNIYFPIILLALTAATYFSAGARLLSSIGFQQFLDQESEITLELIEEGKEHMKREKRRVQRLNEAGARRGYSVGRSSQPDLVEDDVRPRPILRDTNLDAVTSPERSMSLLDEVVTEPAFLHADQSPSTRTQGPSRNLFDDC